MPSQPKFGLLGITGIAVIVVLIAMIANGPRFSVTQLVPVDSTAAAGGAPNAQRPIRLAYLPPGPPVREDLPAELSRMSPVVVEALLDVDRLLFTRFAPADTHYVPCDEGMPGKLLFGADARVLGYSQDTDNAQVKLELVTVGAAQPEWDGCDLSDAKVDERLQVETLTVSLTRAGGGWAVGCCHDPLVGPLWTISGTDWGALRARADSVRSAAGKPHARPLATEAGFRRSEPYLHELYFPDRTVSACNAGPAPVGGDNRGLIMFVDNARTWSFEVMEGSWWAIHEMGRGGRQTCVTPVEIRRESSRGEQCGPNDPRESAHRLIAPGFNVQPLLLVRNIQGLRTGFQPRLSTVEIPGWNGGLSVYSDSGEMLRVVEGTGTADSIPLNMIFEGQMQALTSIPRDSGSTWDVYWAGFLNGDGQPDLVLRLTSEKERRTDHRLMLVLSSADGRNGEKWSTGAETKVRFCNGGMSIF